MPVAGNIAGAGVSTAVKPLLLMLSVRKNPLEGFINLPEDVAVMEYPNAPFVDTESSCAEILIIPFDKEPKFTKVDVASRPVPGLVVSPAAQEPFCELIFVPFARPVIVNVREGSTVPCT